ncbi:MAG: hypothetical protein PVJ60_02670, partial [Phycisphaerales bacterium]
AARDASGNLTANVLISDVAGGTAPLTVTSTTVVPNLNADQTDGYDASETSTVSTLAARDASANLTANVLISDVAGGTAPLTVTSTTKVANLNADLLDDLNTATASTASTVAARDASGDLTANVLISDVAIGTAPLNVTSTTVVPNLNVDQTDGYDVAETATVSTIAARDAGGDITANAFESTVATGTAPLTVASITKVANLNADLLDDLNSATASTASTIAARDASGNLTANVLISDVAGGTAPLTVTSTTVVPNLNVDQTDGYDASETSTVSTLAARDASANLTANVLISDVAGGTAPLTVTSTTKVANLNADLLDDLNTATASTASTIAARDASGNLTANILISDVADGTAPLTVTSTTVVPNLNADTWDGYQFADYLNQAVKTTSSPTFQTLTIGNNNQSTTTDIKLAYNANIATDSSMIFFIDADNDASTDYFSWRKDAAYGAGTVLMQLTEAGVLTVSGNTVYHAGNFGKTEIDALGINATTVTGAVYQAQGAQTAKTTSTTLTAAEINTGIITVNNGAAGTTTLTLPLATAMDSQFTGVSAGYSWDFSVINISTTAAEDADVGTNTGWTLVGNMDIEADDDPRARSSAKFRARKTGAGAWTLYRTA